MQCMFIFLHSPHLIQAFVQMLHKLDNPLVIEVGHQSSVAIYLLPKISFICGKRWNLEGARSELLGGWSRFFQPNFSHNFVTFSVVCGCAVLWSRHTPLASRPHRWFWIACYSLLSVVWAWCHSWDCRLPSGV
jgi:hypothetical protein